MGVSGHAEISSKFNSSLVVFGSLEKANKFNRGLRGLRGFKKVKNQERIFDADLRR
jgi:hypothetical protein